MSDEPLHETFTGPRMSPRLRWHCEPSRWRIGGESRTLRVEPDAGTDFWRRTHYGFDADNGHFLHLDASGDFVLTTWARSRPKHRYDQAGVMVRVSPDCWIKASVEYEPDGPNRLGAVVTNGGYSDWSTRSIARSVSTLWFRIRAEGADCIVETAPDGLAWEQIRMAHLHERPAAASVACGLYACSPKGAGFRAEFGFLRFQPGRIG